VPAIGGVIEDGQQVRPRCWYPVRGGGFEGTYTEEELALAIAVTEASERARLTRLDIQL